MDPGTFSSQISVAKTVEETLNVLVSLPHTKEHTETVTFRKIFLHQILKSHDSKIFGHPVPIIPLADPVIENVEEEFENNYGNEENEEKISEA